MALYYCNKCGQALLWDAQLAGRQTRCPCGQVVEVPAYEPRAVGQSGAPVKSRGFGALVLIVLALFLVGFVLLPLLGVLMYYRAEIFQYFGGQ